MEVTIKLLENAMGAAMKEGRSREGWTRETGRFLIDGFPRKMDQALKFDETVCASKFTDDVDSKRVDRFVCPPLSFSFPRRRR